MSSFRWALHARVFPRHPKPPPDIDPNNPNILRAYDGAIVTEFMPTRYPQESMLFRQTISSTNPITANGRYSKGVPPHHYHPYQTEFFEVESGRMGYVVNGVTKVLEPGNKIAILPGQRHTWWAEVDPANPVDLVVVLSADPAMATMDEFWFRNLYPAFDNGPTRFPAIFHLFYLLDRGDCVLADPPKPIGWLLNIILGRWIGGIIGGYRYDDKYSYPMGKPKED